MTSKNQKPANRSWPRLLAEVVAIVVSILLAFGIDAWWDERQLRVEEQQILHGLEDEFVSIRDVLARHLGLHLKDLRSLEEVLVTIEKGPSDDAGSSIEAALLEMTSPATTDLGNGSLDALLSSGRIEILTNKTLRARLAEWERVIGEVWDDQANNAKMVFEIYIPYFVSENVAFGTLMGQGYDWPAPVTSIADDPDVIRQLLRDPEFRVLAGARYGFKMHLTGEFESAIAAAEEILVEIENSMD